jgi:hypothetical protein
VSGESGLAGGGAESEARGVVVPCRPARVSISAGSFRQLAGSHCINGWSFPTCHLVVICSYRYNIGNNVGNKSRSVDQEGS